MSSPSRSRTTPSLAFARAFAFALAGVVLGAAGCPTGVASGKPPPPTLDAGPPRFFADPPFGVGFECVTIGCNDARPLVVENRGGGKLALALIRTTVDTSADFTLTCKDGGPLPLPSAQIMLGAGEKLELVVRYTPSDGVVDSGSVAFEHYDGALAFNDAAPKTDHVPLTARVFGTPAAVPDAAVIDFGFVPAGTDATLPLVVENTATDSILSVGPCTREDGTAREFHAPTPREWGVHFANPGGSTSMPIVFSPRDPTVFFGAVLVDTNDPLKPGIRVPVQGTAIVDPRLAVIDPATGVLELPPMRSGDTRTRPLVVRNLGGQPLDVHAELTAGAASGIAIDVADQAAIAPLATATFNVSLSTAQGGEVFGTVLLTSNDPSAPAGIEVPVHGEVDAPVLSVSPPSLEFGDIVQTWTAPPQTVYLGNAGFGELTISSVAFDVGASDEIVLVSVPQLPIKIAPGEPPVGVTVLVNAVNLGAASATLLVGSDSVLGAVARVDVHVNVISCEQGCPIPNGVPDCSGGYCDVGSCFPTFHDADFSPVNGCECREDIVGNTSADIPSACMGLDIGSLHDGNGGGTRSTSRNGTLHAFNDSDLYFFRAVDDGCFFCSDNYGADVTLSGPAGMQLCANFQSAGSGCGGLPTNCRTITSGAVTIRGNGQSGIFGSSDNSEDVTVFVLWPANAPPICGGYNLFMRADGDF